MAVRLSALRTGRPLHPRKIPGTNFFRGRVEPGAILLLEGLGQLKKIHLIGIRTRDLPAGSIVPQPTTLPRAPLARMFNLLGESGYLFKRILNVVRRF
jgi:hypothetical protein